MGQTVVEKILARATGQAGEGGRRCRAASRPGNVTRKCRTGHQSVSRDLQDDRN